MCYQERGEMDRKLLDPSTLQTLCTHSKCVFVQTRKRGKQRGILGVSFRHLSRAWQAKTSPNSAAFYRLGTAELTHKDQYGPNRNLTVVKIIFLHGVSTINRHFERFHTGSGGPDPAPSFFSYRYLASRSQFCPLPLLFFY